MSVSLWQDEITAVTELGDLLAEEYAVLKRRDPAQLEQITGEKQALAGRLQAAVEARSACLTERGFAADGVGIRAYIASLPPADRLRMETLHGVLEEALGRVRRQNEINGAIVAAGRDTVERALAILQGRDSQSSLYGQDARATFGHGAHRSLGRA